jgi:ElaB/YqjD/DUF883 family membrane-anchored ribosome-binding protein
MTADTLEDAADEFTAAASSAADKGQKALNEAIEKAQAKVAETARVAQKALKEHADNLRDQTKVYRETAGQQFDDAQRYVIDKVNERPLAAVLTGLVVGLVLGLLISNRDR